MKYLENRTPYLWLKWITTVMAVAYTLVFFGRLISNRATFHASGLDGELAVPGSPQAMIALCFVMLVLGLWFLKGRWKVVVTISLYLTLLGFFVYWWQLTREIKSSIGRSIIPHTDKIDGIWIGSTPLDPVAFLVALIMFALAIVVLVTTHPTSSHKPTGISHGSPVSGLHI